MTQGPILVGKPSTGLSGWG